MSRKPNHPHIMDEVLASKLRSDPKLLRQNLDAILPEGVPESTAKGAARGGKTVQVLAARQLHSLQRLFRRQAANYERQVVGRTSCCAEFHHLFFHELGEGPFVQNALGFLQELRLVGRAATFRHEQKIIVVPRLRQHVDLRWQVGLCVRLLKHTRCSDLRVTQIAFGVGTIDAMRNVLLIKTVREHITSSRGHHYRSPRVLARWHHLPGRGASVFQQLKRDKTIVARRLWILQNV
mmetsp:Transcript_23879/g.62749  ORF Transcript_23879/g.62749 Transcript_23879/m.62749 type:complete len:236 (-) Transcript_23879:359-1066(-)